MACSKPSGSWRKPNLRTAAPRGSTNSGAYRINDLSQPFVFSVASGDDRHAGSLLCTSNWSSLFPIIQKHCFSHSGLQSSFCCSAGCCKGLHREADRVHTDVAHQNGPAGWTFGHDLPEFEAIEWVNIALSKATESLKWPRFLLREINFSRERRTVRACRTIWICPCSPPPKHGTSTLVAEPRAVYISHRRRAPACSSAR